MALIPVSTMSLSFDRGGIGSAPPFRLQSIPHTADAFEAASSHPGRIINYDDVVAGTFLFVFGGVGIAFYTIVTLSMMRMSKDIVGFRFLISQSISDILLLIQFGIWPGIVIVSQNEIIPASWRFYVHVYLDFTWWAMVYHYPIVAWSRLAAVRFPNWFRTLKPQMCTMICSLAWIIGLVQSILEHQFSWFEALHYDPKLYGLTTDWDRYNTHGTATYYMIFNVSSMILPFPFYGVALYVLFTRQRRQMVDPMRIRIRGNSVASSITNGISAQRSLSIETRLLIPCIINTVLFVVGQVFITLCSKYTGKWISWSLMAIFAANSFVNPVLYVCFSSVIRRHLFADCRKRWSASSVYKDYDYRSSSQISMTFAQRSSLIKVKKEPDSGS
uniref:G_PROTEIN_RECEP_F1_2 domain-containing protein n=1 Tax=Panagrellus redivivus TaxID=6233 RepID=A0A7E4VHF6_PANRE